MARPNRASDAPYTILDDLTQMDTMRINQTQRPTDRSVDGGIWEDLGIHGFNTSNLVTRLPDDVDGSMIAASRLRFSWPHAKEKQ